MMDIPCHHILGLTDDGNPVMVSMVTPVTRASSCVPKPRGVDEMLDLQRGEAKHQVHLP
jgi:hypothetical protein